MARYFALIYHMTPIHPLYLLAQLHFCKATMEMTKYFSGRQVSDAIHNQNGSDSKNAHSMPISSQALVYRPNRERWKGIFFVLETYENVVNLVLPSPTGPTQFRSTVVKLFINESSSSQPAVLPHSQNLVLEDLYQTLSPALTWRDLQTSNAIDIKWAFRFCSYLVRISSANHWQRKSRYARHWSKVAPYKRRIRLHLCSFKGIQFTEWTRSLYSRTRKRIIRSSSLWGTASRYH